MDAPREQESLLQKIPPDIWAHIVEYLPGEQIELLLMTGTTSLRQRLNSPKVVKAITLCEEFGIFKSLPRFLNDFPSLEKLIIHNYRTVQSQEFRLMIESIPSGLRTLGLFGFWDADKLFGQDSTKLKLNEHLPYLETLHWYGLRFTNYSWLTHFPKSLTSLHLRRWDGTVELPSSLVHFEVAIVDLKRDTFVSKLPSSLETFSAGSLSGVELVVPLLPSTSRTLNLGDDLEYSDGLRSPRNLLAQLPKFLTRLIVPFSTEINFETNPELASLLPPTLTELSTEQHLPCSAWPLLPPRLTKLSTKAPESMCTAVSKIVDDHGMQREVKSVAFDTLPRSVRCLELSESNSECYCGPPKEPNRSYFPLQLTNLSAHSIQLSPEAAKLLPPTLTYLETLNLCERVCEHLPTGLRTLIAYKTLMTPNLIKFLPKSLTFVYSTIPRSEDPWFDRNTGEIIDSILNLPEYSIHKNCLSDSFDWKDYAPLPPNLTRFYLESANELGDSFLAHQHLPNLVELCLEHSERVTDTSIPLLSLHLTTLSLQSSSKISGKSFKFLPRNLTFLNLNSSTSIFDSDIQYLPRTLKHAHLSHAVHLTELCVPELPPHLNALEMGHNAQITSSSFSRLPHTLRSLRRYRAVTFANWYIEWGVACPK